MNMFENETVEYWLGYNDFSVNGVLVRTEWHNGRVDHFDSTGEYHREDGPALMDADARFWYRHGVLHRLDGPAITYHNSQHEYWVYGLKYTEDEFKILTFMMHRQAQNTCA